MISSRRVTECVEILERVQESGKFQNWLQEVVNALNEPRDVTTHHDECSSVGSRQNYFREVQNESLGYSE